MKSRSRNLITTAGLAIAALAIVVPIAWDRYRTRTAVELHWLGAAPLVDESIAPDKLQVFYDGKPIKSVTQFQFAIVNAGRTPIRSVDFITPITITFPQQLASVGKFTVMTPMGDVPTSPASAWALSASPAEILDVRVTRTQPPGIDMSASIDKDRTDLRLLTSLLNPGDSVEISAVVAAPATTQLLATGRVVGVSHIEIVDQRSPTTRSPIRNDTILLLGVTTALIGAVST